MNKQLILIICLLMTCQLKAAVTLPGFFTDNMVLQRDQQVRIWGWADPSETIQVSIDNQSQQTKADRAGNWEVLLSPHAAGGPYTLSIIEKGETIELENVLFGDVWFCSGQSNMGWKLRNSTGADEEMNKPEQSMIRLLTVDRTMSAKPNDNATTTGWEVCSAKSMRNFSGVAYFFGQYLQENLDVPIGLIHSSWGGTKVQTWMSKEAMGKFPRYDRYVKALDTVNVERTLETGKDNFEAWLEAMEREDAGLKGKWYEPSADRSGWKSIQLPIYWNEIPIKPTTGIAWVSRKVTLSAQDVANSITISLGRVDDEDIVYVNGKKTGESTNKDLERVYEVDRGVFSEGENEITIRVKNKNGFGGFRSSKEKLYLETGGRKISLAGEWKFRQGTPASFPEMPYQMHPNNYPSLLYNGMVAPFTPMSIKGVVWYQGESNAKEAEEYSRLFPAMIRQWRSAFDNQNLPFLFVQLANYDMPVSDTEHAGYFAELRYAQALTTALPNTGMAVTIDIGEADNVHPANKKDVGKRLSLAARKIAYGEDIEYSGPVFRKMEKKQGKITVYFSHADGLQTKDSKKEVCGFEVAGRGGVFHPAKAAIEGGVIRLSCGEVSNPAEVRYAWANSPENLNMVNSAGLPAVPFTTERIFLNEEKRKNEVH